MLRGKSSKQTYNTILNQVNADWGTMLMTLKRTYVQQRQ